MLIYKWMWASDQGNRYIIHIIFTFIVSYEVISHVKHIIIENVMICRLFCCLLHNPLHHIYRCNHKLRYFCHKNFKPLCLQSLTIICGGWLWTPYSCLHYHDIYEHYDCITQLHFKCTLNERIWQLLSVIRV